MKKLLLLAFILFIVGGKAQDLHFSQYNAQPLLLNPALSGLNECDYRVGALFRTQWYTISGLNTYRTLSAFADMAVYKPRKGSNYLGVGLSFFSDQAGDLNYQTNKVDVSLAYHFIISKRKVNQSLSVGIEGGFAHRSLDLSKAIYAYDSNTGEPIATTEPVDEKPLYYGDVGIGLVYSIAPKPNSSYYIGFALQHLNQPNISGFHTKNSNEKLYMKITSHFGSTIPLTQKLFIQPGFLLLKQGPSFEATISNYFKYKTNPLEKNSLAISLGAMYRVNDAFILATRLDIKGFKLGLAYDINLSKLSAVSKGNGAPEISFSYTGCIKRNKTLMYCPEF